MTGPPQLEVATTKLTSGAGTWFEHETVMFGGQVMITAIDIVSLKSHDSGVHEFSFDGPMG